MYPFVKNKMEMNMTCVPCVTCGQEKGVLAKGIYLPRGNKFSRPTKLQIVYLFDVSWYFFRQTCNIMIYSTNIFVIIPFVVGAIKQRMIKTTAFIATNTEASVTNYLK